LFIKAEFFSADLLQSDAQATIVVPSEGMFFVNGYPKKETTNVFEGDLIKTAPHAKVEVFFPDDSVSRLAPNSEIIIKKLDFNPDTLERKVRIKALSGAVWSKVVKLISSNSGFEVETNTTVAAVRGSAFNVEVGSDGTTEVVATEHTVWFEVIDPETKETLKTTTITEGKKLEVAESIIQDAKERMKQRDLEKKNKVEKPLNEEGDNEENIEGLEKVEIPEEEFEESTLEDFFELEVVDASEEMSSEEWFSDNLGDDEQYEEVVEEKTQKKRKEIAGVLPGSPLYIMKNIRDNAKLKSADSEEERIKVEMEIAQRKLLEANVLSDNGSKNAEKVLQEQLISFEELIEKVDASNVEEIKNEMRKHVLQTKDFLKDAHIGTKNFETRKIIEKAEIVSALNQEEREEIKLRQIERRIIEVHDAAKEDVIIPEIQKELDRIIEEVQESEDIKKSLMDEAGAAEYFHHIEKNALKKSMGDTSNNPLDTMKGNENSPEKLGDTFDFDRAQLKFLFQEEPGFKKGVREESFSGEEVFPNDFSQDEGVKPQAEARLPEISDREIIEHSKDTPPLDEKNFPKKRFEETEALDEFHNLDTPKSFDKMPRVRIPEEEHLQEFIMPDENLDMIKNLEESIFDTNFNHREKGEEGESKVDMDMLKKGFNMFQNFSKDEGIPEVNDIMPSIEKIDPSRKRDDISPARERSIPEPLPEPRKEEPIDSELLKDGWESVDIQPKNKPEPDFELNSTLETEPEKMHIDTKNNNSERRAGTREERHQNFDDK
ncbi:FecR domain-containing protein, partial [Candidatus Peregrinibacteria bacterium]|nr:FecR domain-containing protein [Candidatus Peregrinibacteria bacterium]